MREWPVKLCDPIVTHGPNLNALFRNKELIYKALYKSSCLLYLLHFVHDTANNNYPPLLLHERPCTEAEVTSASRAVGLHVTASSLHLCEAESATSERPFSGTGSSNMRLLRSKPYSRNISRRRFITLQQ